MDQKSTIFFLRGVPGTGKTTLAKELEKTGMFTRITADEVGLHGWKQHLIESIEKKDKYIILDRCHSSKKQRENALKVLEPYKSNIKKILVTLDKPSFRVLATRINNDVGHAYGVSERLVALRYHSSEICNDNRNISCEVFDQHIVLKQNNAASFLSEITQ